MPDTERKQMTWIDKNSGSTEPLLFEQIFSMATTATKMQLTAVV